MKTRKCKICNIEKELNEFYKTNNGSNYRGECKNCQKAIKKEWYKKNCENEKIYKKKYRKLNKEKIADWQREYQSNPEYKKRKSESNKERYKNNTLDHYIVYYLPKINYCGVTRHPANRMYCHVSHGNDTTGWKVLAKAKTKKEALEIESKYHSEMGMEGAYGWKLQSKNE